MGNIFLFVFYTRTRITHTHTNRHSFPPSRRGRRCRFRDQSGWTTFQQQHARLTIGVFLDFGYSIFLEHTPVPFDRVEFMCEKNLYRRSVETKMTIFINKLSFIFFFRIGQSTQRYSGFVAIVPLQTANGIKKVTQAE